MADAIVFASSIGGALIAVSTALVAWHSLSGKQLQITSVELHLPAVLVAHAHTAIQATDPPPTLRAVCQAALSACGLLAWAAVAWWARATNYTMDRGYSMPAHVHAGQRMSVAVTVLVASYALLASL